MKRLTTTFTVLFITACIANAQSFESDIESPEFPKTVFGIKSGINVSRFTASNGTTSNSRAGLNLGFFVRMPITEEAFFRPELYYSSQGSPVDRIDYLNLPIVLEYGQKFSLQVGAQLGILLSASSEDPALKGNLEDELRHTDLSLLGGFGFSPGKHFTVGVRYNVGFNDILKGNDVTGVRSSFAGPPVTQPPTVHNRVLHFYIGYAF